MPFSSLFRNSAPSPTNAAIIELIYAGNDMAAHLVMKDGRDFSCVCGMIAGPVENPSHHRNFCPVGRFYAAVEAVRLPAQVPAPTSRYSTPREDAILFAVLGTITVALIWAVVHFAPIIDAWIIPAWVKVLSISVMVALIVASRIKRGAKW